MQCLATSEAASDGLFKACKALQDIAFESLVSAVPAKSTAEPPDAA